MRLSASDGTFMMNFPSWFVTVPTPEAPVVTLTAAMALPVSLSITFPDMLVSDWAPDRKQPRPIPMMVIDSLKNILMQALKDNKKYWISNIAQRKVKYIKGKF